MTLPNWWYEELRSLAARSRQVVFLAAVTGAVTGLAVALFDRVVVDGFLVWILDSTALGPGHPPDDRPDGLCPAAALSRPTSSPATADEYILAFHDPERRLTPRAFVVKVSASLATFAGGGALGLEGPAIFIGSGFGRFIHRRLPPSLPWRDAHAVGGRSGCRCGGDLQGAGHRSGVRPRGAVPGRPGPEIVVAGAGGRGGRVPHLRERERHGTADPDQGVRQRFHGSGPGCRGRCSVCCAAEGPVSSPG